MKTTKKGKALAPVVDIFPQLLVSYHDNARIDEEMRLLKELGFERVYFVLCNPGYPVFSNPRMMVQPPGFDPENHSYESIMALGDPNFAYLYNCHKHGMEAFAVIKPYEGGGGTSIPHWAKLPWEQFRDKSVGGDWIGFDSLISHNPHLRVKRKPINNYDELVSQPITRLTASFCLDALPEVNYSGIKPENVEELTNRFSLCVSKDNCHYLPLTGNHRISGKIEDIPVYDFNNIRVGEKTFRCFTLEINDLELDDGTDYLALLVRNGGKLYSIPQSMLKIYGPEGEIPSTSAMYIRKGGNPDESCRRSSSGGNNCVFGTLHVCDGLRSQRPLQGIFGGDS